MMSHRAVLAFFRGLVDHCGLGPSARVGTFAPLQFDFSLLDMGLAFGSGATLVQVPRILFHNPKQLLGYLNETRVTQMNSVPALWRAILRHAGENLTQLRHLEAILFAGEPFPIADLIRLRASLPSLRVINCFGQSESIACSFTDVPIPLPPETENLSIGFAHPGAEMLLIDPQGQEIRDPGIVGEIYLRGATLFLGYWRDPNATAEALVLNPLRPLSGERVFRTGDMAYKGPIGDLYFCGRRDQQVKILGNRVELAEVESRLCAHSGVDQAVAVATRYQDDTKLIAYVVRKKDGPAVTRDELHLFCKSNLNSYMIPTLIKFVDTLPINSNGKLDRASLFTDKLI